MLSTGEGRRNRTDCSLPSEPRYGDYVWDTGSFHNPLEKDLETWFIRGGSAGATLYTFRQPGVYVYLNHMLAEAVELGALAHFKSKANGTMI
jgi:Multicopper oxidase